MSNKIWSSAKVKEQIKKIENGYEVDVSCFHEGDLTLRKANINFQYTKEEQEEIIKCANDVLYFARRYCYAMTDDGVVKINLRDYQEDMLTDFQNNRFVVMMSSRQTGKCLKYNSKITIYDNKNHTYIKISIGNLFYLKLKQKRKLTILEKIKWKLWILYDKLD